MRKLRFFLYLAIVTLVFIPKLSFSEIIERVAAVAGDEIITLQDVREEGAVLFAMQNDDIQRLANLSPEEQKKQLNEITKRLVQRRLVEKEAVRLSSPIGEREVQQQLDAIISQSGGTEADFKEYLAGFGLKYDIFRAVIRGELQTQYVMRSQLGGQVSINEADVVACARENSPEAERGLAMDLKQILIKDIEADAQAGLEVEIASKLNASWWNGVDTLTKIVANGVQEELKSNPAWFPEALKLYSTGQSVAQEGKLGTFLPSELSKDFAQVFSLPKGGVSELIRTNAGYHIIYVDDIKEGVSEAWDKAKESCRNKLMMVEGERLTQSWLSSMMDKSFVSIRVSDDISKNASMNP